jgi:hypothetical protein
MPPDWTPTHSMTNEAYHLHPAVSRSALNYLLRSPKHYWEAMLNPDRVPQESTPAMLFGTAVHTAVLEPDLFATEYALAPPVTRTTKAGKEAWALAAEGGKQLLTSAEWNSIEGIKTSIQAHPAASKCLLTAGLNECTFIAKDPVTGLDLKCRPDRFTDSGWVVDLKTTQDASTAEFAKSIHKFGYHIQAAFYLHTIEIATGRRPLGFIFMAVEKTAPYAVQMLRLGESSMQLGNEIVQLQLARLAYCLAADSWPGYEDSVVDVELPAWALK